LLSEDVLGVQRGVGAAAHVCRLPGDGEKTNVVFGQGLVLLVMVVFDPAGCGRAGEVAPPEDGSLPEYARSKLDEVLSVHFGVDRLRAIRSR
jgi:hypothetical protein